MSLLFITIGSIIKGYVGSIAHLQNGFRVCSVVLLKGGALLKGGERLGQLNTFEYAYAYAYTPRVDPLN